MLRMRWSTEVCTTPTATAPIASDQILRPSHTTVQAPATPRFLIFGAPMLDRADRSTVSG